MSYCLCKASAFCVASCRANVARTTTLRVTQISVVIRATFALQLATQQCCATSCTILLLVLPHLEKYELQNRELVVQNERIASCRVISVIFSISFLFFERISCTKYKLFLVFLQPRGISLRKESYLKFLP